MSDTHTAKKPNETSAAPTTEQKYKTACGNRIVMRKLPSDDGTSLIDAIRGESRLADQVVARYPDETQVRAWIEEHFKAHEAVPYKHQMCLKPFMGGIFAFPVGLSDQCLASALSDADDQKAMAAYMNHCRSTYLGVCKVSGDVQDFVAVEVPSVATQIEWTIEHYKTVGSPKPGEVKIVEWQHGLYPFAIGDFFTNTVLPQVYNVPDADAVAVAEALAAILKSGHSERPIEYLYTGGGCTGMGGLNEYLNLGGVEVAEPEQEADEACGVEGGFGGQFH